MVSIDQNLLSSKYNSTFGSKNKNLLTSYNDDNINEKYFQLNIISNINKLL